MSLRRSLPQSLVAAPRKRDPVALPAMRTTFCSFGDRKSCAIVQDAYPVAIGRSAEHFLMLVPLFLKSTRYFHRRLTRRSEFLSSAPTRSNQATIATTVPWCTTDSTTPADLATGGSHCTPGRRPTVFGGATAGSHCTPGRRPTVFGGATGGSRCHRLKCKLEQSMHYRYRDLVVLHEMADFEPRLLQPYLPCNSKVNI